MSTQVGIPMFSYGFGIRMSERQQSLPLLSTHAVTTTSASTVTQPDQALRRSVRKNLFGPIDTEQNCDFVRKELNKIYETDCKKWNFDFKNEKPMSGRFDWEPIAKKQSGTTVSSSTVPTAYEIPSLSISTSTTPSSSSTTSIVHAVHAPSIITDRVSSTCPTTPEATSPNSKITSSSTSVNTTTQERLQPTTTVTLESEPQTTTPTTIDNHATIKSRQSTITDFMTIRKKRSPVSRETNSKSKRSLDTSDDDLPKVLSKRPRTSSSS